MNKKIVLTILLLFLFGCQRLPGRTRLAQFKDSPASTLTLSDDTFYNATDTLPFGLYWINKDYLSVNGMIDNPKSRWSPVAIKIPELSIVSRFEDAYSGHAKISPDGKYLITFVNAPARGNSIWGISSLTDLLESGKDTLLYSFPLDEYDLNDYAWSRDSQNLAMITIISKSGRITLQIYNLPTHSLRRVFEFVDQIKDSRLYPSGGSMSWSADGTRLAFSVGYATNINSDHSDEQSDLFIYNIEQNKLVKVTSTPNVYESYPVWHPETNMLMFITSDDPYEMGYGKLSFLANDGECIRILPGYEGITDPSWSPDGKQIAYISTDGIEFLDVEKIIPPEYLSPDTLCQTSDGSGE
jgi:dipeptidyl aminopeptidase/acylaminoacyl peptidase